MIRDEEVLDEVVEAKRQGHRYIKLFLDRSRIGRNQDSIIISGAVILRGIRKGSGIGGLPDYEFQAVAGESLVFTFSREEREYICWMYDDEMPGYFSPVGYNRDLLASHLNESFFIINDVAVLQDVQNRAQWLVDNPKRRNQRQSNPSFAGQATKATSVDELDREIEILKERKRLAIQSGGNASGFDDTIARQNLDLTKTSNLNAEKNTIREDRNRKQREYRAKKKAEQSGTSTGQPEHKELEPANA